MRLIGLDPGLTHTGWGVVESRGTRLSHLGSGRISPRTSDSLPARLDVIYAGLREVAETFCPDEAAVEETVVNKNGASSLKLGQARGVVLLAAAHQGIAITEYAAKTVKRALVGTGSADKAQVEAMVRHLLPGLGTLAPDTADALAVALCHAHHAATRDRLAPALAKGGT